MSNSDKVTLRDIYDAVGSLEAKIDRRIVKIEDEVADTRAFQNKAIGVLGIASAFVSVSASYIWNKFIGNS